MAGRSNVWGGRSPPAYTTDDHGGRRRHDQQRLLVELELDDSLYQGVLRTGVDQGGLWQSESIPNMKTQYGPDKSPQRFHISYGQHIAEPKVRPPSRTSRDSAGKQSGGRQTQQTQAKRLSSPYKLKQQVLGSRNESEVVDSNRNLPQRLPHKVNIGAVQRSVRSLPTQQSPVQLVVGSIRQNMRLRDQVMAHLQQELLGVLPLHRATHVEKNVPQRVVKMLNKMRSVSLAVVEAVVYLSNELGDPGIVGSSVEHDVLEQEFYSYLLQMTSDTDFLACSPPLQRFFEDFEVNLMRNPFVDGLSLDSSEVMLCSCHHSASSGALFSSASFSSSSLFRLMTVKLEEFAQKTQQYLPGWQVLPKVRVAAALLHLVDLETRFNAVQQLPRYLQPPTTYGDNRKYLQPPHGVDQISFGYGMFEDEQMPWLTRHDARSSITNDHDIPRGTISVTEAWGGSPIAKKLMTSDSAPSLSRPDIETIRSKTPKEATMELSSKEDSVRSSSVSSSAWGERITAPESNSANTRISAVSAPLSFIASSPQRKAPVGIISHGDQVSENTGISRITLKLPLPDTAAEAKSSSRSTLSERSASKKTVKRIETKVNTGIFIDAETQMTERTTPDDLFTESESATSIPTTKDLLVNSARGEAIEVCEITPARIEVEQRPTGSVCKESLHLDMIGDHSVANESPMMPKVDIGTLDPSERFDCNLAHLDEPGVLVDIEPGLNDYEMVLSAEGINSSPECEIPKDGGAEAGECGDYDCDFEYSSNDALSSIAQALNMLPNFSFFNSELSLVDEAQTSDEAIPMSDNGINSPTEDTVEPAEGTAVLANFSGISANSSTLEAFATSSRYLFESNGQGVIIPKVDKQDELNDVEMKVETILPPEDEFSYTSSIAKALSLLPQVSFVDTLVSPEMLSGHQVAPSPAYAFTTNRTIETPELPWQKFCLSPMSVVDDMPAYYPSSNSVPVAKGTKDDNAQEGSNGINRIFSLCQDIQVAAYDLNHWTSQREVESHAQTVAKSFSSSMGYSSPNAHIDNAPQYLERELKMLRRNFASWKEVCVERRRAKRLVRRSAAKRRIWQFIHHHYQLRVQAQEDEEARVYFHAASQLQQNWSIYRHNREAFRRKAAFRSVHMAFHRALFFVGISRRRHKREDAKEKIFRWWRCQRCRMRKKKQRQDKAGRERDRRVHALKEVQRFLKEIVLRRKLKAAQETTKNILFKEQLKWTKAKRDAEINMELHSKHHRELIADMNAKLEGLDSKWKASELENVQLLTQRQHTVQQQKHLLEMRRRQLAALKIQLFLKVCCLHRRLQRVESEKHRFELKLQEERRAKEKLSVESQRHVGKSRAQARVLERKIGRLSQQISQASVHHHSVIQAHEARERTVLEFAARKTIKAFIDIRVLARRAQKDRQQILLEQVRIRAEKAELELMSEQDQFEKHRTATSIALELTQRLSQLKQQSDALVIAKDRLAQEKQQEIDEAVRQLEHSKVESSMQQIASWVSGHLQLSKLKKQQAEICASVEHDLEEIKQRQRKELETRVREVTSIKVSNLAHHTVVKRRNSRAMAIARVEEHDRSIRQKAIAERTQAQLVQIIIEVKLLSERESNCGIVQALDGTTHLRRVVAHKVQRLKHLQRMNSARKIQRAFRRWMQQQKIKRAEKIVVAQLEEALRRRALTRKIQAWWRHWARERRRQREQELAFEAHLDAIRRKANVRKIQAIWRCWCHHRRLEREHIQIERQQFVSAYRIQRRWRKWQQHQREKTERIRIVHDTSAQLIRQVWTRCRQAEDEKRQLQMRREVCARRLQKIWRRWYQWQCIRELSAKRIQQRWQKWDEEQKKKAEAERVRRSHILAATAIQRNWCRWKRKRQQEKENAQRRHRLQISSLKIQTVCCKWWQRRQKERLEAKAAERIQRSRRRWKWQLEEKRVRVERENENAMRIQKLWRSYEQFQRVKAEKIRRHKQERTSAVKIEKMWMKHRAWRKMEVERRGCGALVIQRKWRRWQYRQQATQTRQLIKKEQQASAIKLQRVWLKWHRVQSEQQELARRLHEQEQKRVAALIIQTQWRRALHLRQILEVGGYQLQKHACASKIQELWRRCYRTCREQGEKERFKLEAKQFQQKKDSNALKIQSFWRKQHEYRAEQREKDILLQAQTTISVRIQRNWGTRQHHRKMENERVKHLQHVSALKIQGHWLKWHHHHQEELEKERIRQEQDASSLKIQRSWGISLHRRKVAQERIRHRENMNALKIQKQWQRWQNLRLGMQVCRNSKDIKNTSLQKVRNVSAVQVPDQQSLPATESNKASEREGRERQRKLDEMLYRFSGRCIARTVKKFHQKNRHQVNAATRIEAIWRGRICRLQYKEALEAKRQEDTRIYLLKVSVFAAKVQVCWRQWQVGIRQAKRLAVKAEEMRLIEEEKARVRKRVVARRISAAMRIQPLMLVCAQIKEHVGREDQIGESGQDKDQRDKEVEAMKAPEGDVNRAGVKVAVKDWSHRELPHILTSSVNRVLFCHDGAAVLQRFVRGCQRRHQLHFYFQRSFSISISEPGDGDEATKFEHFHFYFKSAKAWLEWGRHKNLSSSASAERSSEPPSRLQLRFDGQMTRKLLQMFEPDAVHSTFELKEALQEIAADAFPIFQSPACLQSNISPKSDLYYHKVGETDLPHFIALMRDMSKRRAQIRREQLLEVDTQVVMVSPVLSAPSSPLSFAPSSPLLSQRAKWEVTIFDAVENASVEEAIFLQQRGADLGAVEAKTQRNVLHMLAFSTETYRYRAEMLEFLLRSETNLDVNAVDCNGDTPLMLYASLGHFEFMQKLLKHGADIQMTNSKGQNVLHCACEKDQVEICGFLQQLMMTKSTVIGNAVATETIVALPSGFSLHTPDSTGRYPLHILVEQGFVECAKQILVPTTVNTEWNCMLQAQGDSQGRTALHLAVLTHDAGMATFLLIPGGGADVNAIDELRRAPLHFAVESPAALPIISRLAQHGADLNVADERGDTPLHWAAFSGRTAVMQHLLSLGADPTLVNSDWESPAQIAAAYGQLDGMRVLLQAQRRYEAASKAEPTEQQRPPTRLPSEKTVFERLEEAVNHVHQKQAAAQSYRASTEDTDPDAANIDERSSGQGSANAEQSRGGYWEELHQDVQLVEESGQFSSEDEADLLFGHDSDDDTPTF